MDDLGDITVKADELVGILARVMNRTVRTTAFREGRRLEDDPAEILSLARAYDLAREVRAYLERERTP